MDTLRGISIIVLGALLSPLILLGLFASVTVSGVQAGWMTGARLLDWMAD